jgi:hypothetical protein
MTLEAFLFDYVHYVAGSLIRLDEVFSRWMLFVPSTERAEWTLDRFRREIEPLGILVGRGGRERRLCVGNAAWLPKPATGPALVLVNNWLRPKRGRGK